MADCEGARKVAEVLLVEDLGDQAHPGPHVEPLTVRGGYPGALLPPVLQGIEAVERHPCDVVSRRKNAENATLFAEVLSHLTSLPGDRGDTPMVPRLDAAQQNRDRRTSKTTLAGLRRLCED